MSGAPSSQPIAVIPKNKMEEIRIELSQFNGHDLLNVRVWAEKRDGAGERIPTKAGIAAKVALLPELIAALQKAEAEARRQGLLPQSQEREPRPIGDEVRDWIDGGARG